MNNREQQLTAAYILHRRPYRNTSLILEFFTKTHGRITAIARGARSGKPGQKAVFQAFTPCLINWYGKNNLVTLRHIEASDLPRVSMGNALFCGFYLNELLVRVLTHQDPYASLFDAYDQCLINLTQADQEVALRQFELILLQELGYALQLQSTYENQAIAHDSFYYYHPDKGFSLCSENNTQQITAKNTVFSGENLLALANNDFTQASTKRAAKQLMRFALKRFIGDKPLASRSLFLE